MTKKVIIVGSGNAALSAGIAALEKGADVSIYEKADTYQYGVVDVLYINEGSIKLSRKDKYHDGREVIATYTINRINGDFNRKYEFIDSSLLYKGNCSKSDKKLF